MIQYYIPVRFLNNFTIKRFTALNIFLLSLPASFHTTKRFVAALVITLLCSFPVSAGTITFEGVLDDAIYLSGETRLARIDKVISQRAKQEATSAFYPRLSLSLGTNYLYDYANKPGYTTINGMYYDTASQWQSTSSAKTDEIQMKGSSRKKNEQCKL
jgi:hypothetical protein